MRTKTVWIKRIFIASSTVILFAALLAAAVFWSLEWATEREKHDQIEIARVVQHVTKFGLPSSPEEAMKICDLTLIGIKEDRVGYYTGVVGRIDTWVVLDDKGLVTVEHGAGKQGDDDHRPERRAR